MYNRYIRNDCGEYDPIQEQPPIHNAASRTAPVSSSPAQTKPQKQTNFSLQALLKTLKLDNIDRGDMLLLLLLLFLFQDGNDEELLIALALLLIL